jgi:hypothetical protein
MIGTPPQNFVFQFMSSKRIVPSTTIQPRMYNEGGYVPHPLQHFGIAGGAITSGYAREPVAGVTGLAPGGIAQSIAGTHGITG